MLNVRQHNPLLRNRLLSYITAHDAAGLADCLATLSNTEFRTAGFLLGEELLPLLGNEEEQEATVFWDFFLTIVPRHPKAYLGTFLKAAASLYKAEKLSLNDGRLDSYAKEQASPIDCKKALEALLPEIKTPQDGMRLLQLFSEEKAEAQVQALLKTSTPVGYYLLFRTLKTCEENRQLLHQCCIALLKKGDSRSFNLACILYEYFGLDQLPATFSLQIRPYQLGRLDDSYESFLKILH